MSGRWLTAEEAAVILRVTKRTVMEKARHGVIRGSKPGDRWLFEQADLDEYVARGANTTDAPTRRRRRRAA